MKLNTRVSTMIAIAVLMAGAGCTTGYFIKRANKLELAGQHDEAANLYLEAFQYNPSDPAIRSGLYRNARLHTEYLTDKVQEHYRKGELKETVYSYLEVRNYVQSFASRGIAIDINPAATLIFENARESYLAERYRLGEQFVGNRQYREAKPIFEEIRHLQPGYHESEDLLRTSTWEPVYAEAVRLFDQGNFIQAYYKFESIVKQAGTYKDSGQRMQLSLNERYKQGTLFLMDERFEDAAKALGEVYRIDPGYRDVHALYAEARNEPVYRQGIRFLQEGRCRSAYGVFGRLGSEIGGYKQSENLRLQALECAQFPVAIVTVPGPASEQYASQLQSQVMSSILAANDPFIRVIDLSVVNPRLDKLIRQSGALSATVAQELVQQHGILTILLLRFEQFELKEGKRDVREVTAFEKLQPEKTAEETSTEYREVQYQHITRENMVSAHVAYRLVSTRTGQLLQSDQVSDDCHSRAEFARYNGNVRNLYPSRRRGDNTLEPNPEGYHRLQQLLRAPDEVQPLHILVKDVFSYVSAIVSSKVLNYNPER